MLGTPLEKRKDKINFKIEKSTLLRVIARLIGEFGKYEVQTHETS